MSAVDQHTKVVNVAPRIGRDSFCRILKESSSPATDDCEAGYAAVVGLGIDPLFAISVFAHESQLGKLGVCHDFSTMNPGNVRSSSAGVGRVIQTPRGPFVKFDSWVDGWRDLAHRLTNPRYPYAQQGAVTVGTILPIWAPKGDFDNTPDRYVAAVIRDMTRWQESAEEPSVDLTTTIGARITAHGPELHDIRMSMPNDDGYSRYAPGLPDHTAIHYTGVPRTPSTLDAETASWVGHGNYHRNTQGWPGIAYSIGISLSGRVFLLGDVDKWRYHAFNANPRCFPVSCDMTNGQEPTPAMLRSLAAVLTVLHDESPEFPGLVRERTFGHKELVFLDARNGSTLCPGNLLPHVARYRAGESIMPPDNAPQPDPPQPEPVRPDCRYFPETGQYLCFGFRAFWESEPNALAYWGFPISTEFKRDNITVQYFERARFEHHAGSGGYPPNPWDVMLGRLGDEADEVDRVNVPEAFARRSL